jgi:hypothetical protein
LIQFHESCNNLCLCGSPNNIPMHARLRAPQEGAEGGHWIVLDQNAMKLHNYLLQTNNKKFVCKKPTKCVQVEKATWYLDYWWREKMVKLLQA